MTFLLDANVDLRVGDFLEQLGHDVTSVVRDHDPSMADTAILDIAAREGRCLIAHDIGFAQLVFLERRPHAGVILFRLDDDRLASKVERLAFLIDTTGIDPMKFYVIRTRSIRARSTTDLDIRY
jgi:predicted nuclease of predicted toxin-antitoxin system